MHKKTRDVAKELQCEAWQLVYLINSGKLQAPTRDSAQEYAWLPEDIERARAVLATWKGRRVGRAAPAE